MSETTLCLFCGGTNIPLTWDEGDGRWVTVDHDDEAHGNRPCLGSGK